MSAPLKSAKGEQLVSLNQVIHLIDEFRRSGPNTAADRKQFFALVNLLEDRLEAREAVTMSSQLVVTPEAEPSFECMIIDADLPSGTIRFYAPRDFPIRAGMFEIRPLRASTEQDKISFEGRAGVPELGARETECAA